LWPLLSSEHPTEEAVVSGLSTCQFCGEDFPDLILGRHDETCPETPIARAERELIAAWVEACHTDAEEHGIEALSGAVLNVVDEAAAAYEDDPDIGGVVSDAFDAHMHDFTASDYARLSLLGEGLLREGPTLPPDLAADYLRAPNRSEVTFGLMSMVADELGIPSAYDGAGVDDDVDVPEKGSGDSRRPASGDPRGWTTRLFRRKQIMPGVRLNLLKSGVSVSLGVKGGHVT
jgi:hypothetical protein